MDLRKGRSIQTMTATKMSQVTVDLHTWQWLISTFWSSRYKWWITGIWFRLHFKLFSGLQQKCTQSPRFTTDFLQVSRKPSNTLQSYSHFPLFSLWSIYGMNMNKGKCPISPPFPLYIHMGDPSDGLDRRTCVPLSVRGLPLREIRAWGSRFVIRARQLK